MKKQMLKRLTCMLLTAFLILSLTACGDDPATQALKDAASQAADAALDAGKDSLNSSKGDVVDAFREAAQQAAEEAAQQARESAEEVSGEALNQAKDAMADAASKFQDALKDAGLNTTDTSGAAGTVEIAEDGAYTSRDDVALYLHTYGKLPGNFITKKQAKALGWEGGSLEPYAPGKCIGGDYFGNYEGNLPEKSGREYHECDIDTLGADSRGPKRIVYSNDGLIYYTEDHYETFTLLYGDED